MILAASALSKGLLVVVSTSLLGSILSNLLLVLGCCFLFGGVRHKQQHFSMSANKVSSSLLFLSCIGIIIPTAIDTLPIQPHLSSKDVLTISHISAIVLLGVYLLYLLFELYTHNFLFTSSGEDEEEHRPTLSAAGAIVLLAAITVGVAVASEFLTGSIEEVSKATGLSKAFIGIIILPIAGNACEHASAVMVAMKDKMDLAIGIALGSSIQIAIFAIPFITLLGWAIGQPFSLSFDPFVTLALTVAVIHTNFITDEATSHWLMGVQLLSTYLLIGVTFLFR
jgi:Ca2+:H+ antiporter